MPRPINALDVSNHVQETMQLIEQKDSKKLSELLDSLHPVELVSLANSFEPDLQPQLLKHITGLDQLAHFISLSGESLRDTALELLDDCRIAAVVRRLEIDDAADIVGALPRRRQVKVLKRLSAETVKELTTLLAYDQDTAGGLMTIHFLSFPPELSVNEAITNLRGRLLAKELDENADLSYGYVLDSVGVLQGVVSLRGILSAEPEQILKELMEREIISVSPEDDQEKVARLIADYDLSAIPVVAPENNKMLGVVTVDDILDVLVEEHTEDMLKLAGTEDQDRIGASTLVAIRSRLPWLFASWIGGTLGALLLGGFSSAFEKVIALAFFMPVVFGMGGNVGQQCSTITVRGLATGELGQYRVWSRFKKEVSVGILLGLIFGVLLFGVAMFMYHDRRLAEIVGLAIMASMSVAASLGSMLPLLMQRLGFDPAVASGPFVSTGTDILSITIYFSIASFLL